MAADVVESERIVETVLAGLEVEFDLELVEKGRGRLVLQCL